MEPKETAPGERAKLSQKDPINHVKQTQNQRRKKDSPKKSRGSTKNAHSSREQSGGKRKTAVPHREEHAHHSRERSGERREREKVVKNTTHRPKRHPSEIRDRKKPPHPSRLSSETRARDTSFTDTAHRQNEKNSTDISVSSILHRPSEKRDRKIFFSDTAHRLSETPDGEISFSATNNRPSDKHGTKISFSEYIYRPSDGNTSFSNTTQSPTEKRDGEPSLSSRPRKLSILQQSSSRLEHPAYRSGSYKSNQVAPKVAQKPELARKDSTKMRRSRITDRPEPKRRPSMMVSWISKMNLTRHAQVSETLTVSTESQSSFEFASEESNRKLFMYKQRETDKEWSKDVLKESDYDPHEFRECDYQTSNAEALLLMVKFCLGTGVFTMPEAYKYAGLFYGMVSTFWVITFVSYGISTLVKCQYLLCKRLRIPSITYPDTLVAALTIGPKNLRRYARNSGYFLTFLILLNRFCNCTVYIIFMAKHVKELIDLHTSKKVALEVYMVFLTVPLSVISSVRTIKFLAPIAMAANVCMLVSIGVTLTYMVTSLSDLHEKQGVGKIWDLPLALSTTMFAFDSVTSVVVVENTMKEPKSFAGFFGVFSIAILILTVSFTGIGFFGYWRFGDRVMSIVTLNLPANEILCQVIMVLSASAVWASYSLQVFVPIFYLSRPLRNVPHPYAWEYLLRVCWVIFPLIFAASVPELKIIIPFFGSLCGPLLQFGFPALIEFCLKYSDTMTYGRWIAVVDICIIIYALTGVVTGLHSTATKFF